MGHRKKKRPIGGPRAIIRPLDRTDLRNPDHPSHREQWLELARSIARDLADKEWDLQYKKGRRTPMRADSKDNQDALVCPSCGYRIRRKERQSNRNH